MTINIDSFGKITASKDTLNALSLVFIQAEESESNKGHNACAKLYRNIANKIYDKLDETGYYD